MYEYDDDEEGGRSLGRSVALGASVVVAIAAARVVRRQAEARQRRRGRRRGHPGRRPSRRIDVGGGDGASPRDRTTRRRRRRHDGRRPTSVDVGRRRSTGARDAAATDDGRRDDDRARRRRPRRRPRAAADAGRLPPYETLPDGSPAPVVAIFDTDSITLTGAVPDEAAKDRLQALAVANAKPGQAATVDNQLTINPAVPRSVGVRVVELTSARFPEGSAEVLPEHAVELDRVVTSPPTTGAGRSEARQHGKCATQAVACEQDDAGDCDSVDEIRAGASGRSGWIRAHDPTGREIITEAGWSRAAGLRRSAPRYSWLKRR